MSNKDNKRVHVYISGRVQGVGFRNFTRKTAKKLGVTGWVKNLSDGRVETVLSGKQEKVNEMLGYLEKGPSLARVDDIQYEEEKYKDEFSKFQITY